MVNTETTPGAVAEIPPTLAGFALVVVENLRKYFNVTREQQVIKLCGETGEFAEAYARYAGMARRSGTLEDVAQELADVVITAYIAARVIGIDLDQAWHAKAQVVLSRGWRETDDD